MVKPLNRRIIRRRISWRQNELLAAVNIETTRSGKDWRNNDSWSFDIFIDDKKAGTASVIGTSLGCFIDLIMLNKDFQGKRNGELIYQAIEAKIGEPLMPSPLGLSDSALSIWKKRLLTWPPAKVNTMLDRAELVGVEMGARKEHVVERLAPLRR